MSKKIEAVIFDWAGTTVDYGCFAPVQAFTNVIKLRIIILSHQQIFDIFVDEIFTFLHSKKTD